MTDGGTKAPGAGDDPVLDDLPDLVAVFDPETSAICRVNDRYVEFYGHDRETIRDRGFDGLAAPDPVGEGRTPAAAIDAVRDGSGPVTVEWEVETANGEKRWLETRLRQTTVGGEKRIVTTERDVTERKDDRIDFERAMAESASPTSFHDPETGAMLAASQGFADVLGYPDRSTLVSAGLDALAPADADDSIGRLCDLIGRVSERMTLETTEWTTTDANGDRVWFQASLTPGSVEADRVVICQWSDVSERRALERTYREVFEGVSDGLVVHETDSGRIVDVNDRYCEMMGYDRDELVGATVDLITDPDADVSYEGARERIRRAGEDGPQLFEWPAYTADGDRFPAEVHLSLVEIRGEERVLASVRDVTERKRRQREYEQIFDGVNDAISVHDPWNEAMIDVNETLCDIVGHDRETVLSVGIDGISAGSDGFTEDRAYEIQREVAETGEPRTVEWKVETAVGEQRLLETNVTPATVGGEDRVLVLSRDVTERRRRRRQLEAIVERIDEAVALSEAATEFDQPEYVSPAIESITGIDHEKLTADMTRFGERIHPEDRPEYEAGMKTMIDDVESGDPADRYDFEFRYRRTDDEMRWIHLTTYPLPETEQYGRVTVFQDVTERKRREQEYEQIFDAVIDGITVHDPETGEIIDANEAMTDLVGYSRETILELGIEGLSHAEAGYTAEKGMEIIDRVMERGESEVVEWMAETADGEKRWLEVKATPAVIGGEERYVAIDRDVTERKRREREYEQIFDSVTDAIAVHDPATGEILEVNQTYADLLGYDRETLVERGMDGISDTDAGYTAERGKELIDRVLAGESVDPFEWAVRNADGERRWFEVQLTEATVGGEQRVLGISRDVTERLERQREIAEEREKYSTLVEQSTDGVAVVQDGEYTFVNERLAEITGYDRTELLGTDFHRVFTPEYRDLVAERHRQRVAGESPPSQYDVEVEGLDGSRSTLELSVSRITHEGEPATLANFRDVTERRARERKLERTQKQFRQIAEAVDEVIHLAAPDLSETYYLSPAYEEVWGRPVEEMYEDPYSFEATLHPEDREEYLDYLDRVTDEISDPEIEEQDVYEYDYRVQRKEDDVRWIEGRIYPIREEDGEVIRIVSLSRDVTEARRRRQTLESFQDATAELTTANSTTEACHTAVSAAATVFDLDAVAVHLYDEETGRLAPTAATDRAGPVEDLPVWTAEDQIPWEAFVDERPIRTGVADAPSLSVDAGDAAQVLPLAGHGLLTVWADEDAVETAETGHLVAATLEGGLNHLVGKRRLESQREELEAQTERAEQMERIAELNRRVEAAITGQSHRIGVERAVCDRLVDIETFVDAWTAEVEPGSDRLTTRTTAGIDRESAEGAIAGDANGRGGHPAQRAWRSNEVAVEDDLVGGTGWRRDLLRRGVQAVCAIPLSYEGITHGVLVVHATDPGAFDEPVPVTLEQLGTSIGYAITAIERRRALESDETIELEFRDDDASVPFARLARATDCQVRHDRTVRRQDGSISVVYTAIGDVPEDVAEVAERILPGDVDVVSHDDDEVVLERSGTTWFGSIVSEYGGVLRRGHATPDRTTVVVELPTEANTRRFVDRLEETIPGVDLFAQRQHQPADATPGEVGARIEQRLSDRQQEALETAYEMGYFDWPRKNSGQAVADAMNITQPTLNKHLRVAERKLLDLILGESES